MTLDSRLRPRATALTSKYGAVAVFIPVTEDADGSAYDVSTGTVDPAGTTSVTTKAVPGTAKDLWGREFARQGDRVIYVPAEAFSVAPKSGDAVTVFGEDWTVLESDPIYSGELAAMYMVFLRRA